MGKRKRRGNCQFSSISDGFAESVANRIVLRLQEQKTVFQEKVMTEFESSLIHGISKLFNKGDYADVTIHLGHIKLPAHGLILALQTPYFKKALYGHFAEGKTKEFSFNDHLHAHWRVIEYMYTGKYSDNIDEFGGIRDDDELMRPVRVYGLADYFCIDGLKKYAHGRLQMLLTQTRDGFADCIRGIYRLDGGPGNEMRALVVGVAYRHLTELMKEKDLVHEGGDFAVELFGKVVTH